MTRGKHGAQAALRREGAEVRSEIATYQRNVKRLSAENRELKDRLAAEHAGRLHDIKILKAQLHEGLSPELLALGKQLDKQTDRAAKATADYKYIQQRWGRVIKRMQRMLVEHFGVHPQAAMEVLVHLVGDEQHVETVLRVLDVPDHIAKRWIREAGGVERHIQISEARGHLSPPTEKRAAMYAAAVAIRQNEKDEDEATA